MTISTFRLSVGFFSLMFACNGAPAQEIQMLQAHLRAKAVWSTQINLTWRYSQPLSVEGIELLIERSVGDSSNYVQIAAVQPFERFYKDLVEPNTRYYYRLRVDHADSESAYSNEASARTPGRELRLTLRSIPSEDGFVCEELSLLNRGGRAIAHLANGEALIVGDLAQNQQCKAILSFDTSALPDNAEIVTWSITLWRGANKGRPRPSLEPGYVEINNNNGFGGSPALRPGDFEAAATPGPFYISKTGRTQFRFFFARPDNGDFSADYEAFYSGESRYAPVLEIVYRNGPSARPPMFRGVRILVPDRR